MYNLEPDKFHIFLTARVEMRTFRPSFRALNHTSLQNAADDMREQLRERGYTDNVTVRSLSLGSDDQWAEGHTLLGEL